MVSFGVGVLPALLWLWFWIREDRLHPEPKKLILLAFLAGMAAVFFVLPVEEFTENIFENSAIIFLCWAIAEEFFKFILCYTATLRNKEYDEPIDAMIYLITSALGFAALENAFFVFSSAKTGILAGIDIGNLRFIGASLLHVVTSGTLGFFIALSFYKKRLAKFFYLIAGFALSVALHASFNLSIIEYVEEDSEYLLIVFSGVWAVAILLLAAFEKIKRLSIGSPGN